MNKVFICIIFLILIELTLSLKLLLKSNLINNINKKHSNNIINFTILTPLLTFPSVSLAADSGSQAAIATPIIISFLTLIPFLYYTQALKPKERTVKQIQVDSDTLKPIDKKDAGKGSTSQAKAAKK